MEIIIFIPIYVTLQHFSKTEVKFDSTVDQTFFQPDRVVQKPVRTPEESGEFYNPISLQIYTHIF